MNLLNKIALGGAQFGLNYGVANISGQIPTKQAKLILKKAISHNISTIDTAISYGESEAKLGKIGIKEWEVITKLPAIPASCKNVAGWISDQTEKSLARLQISQLHGLLLHQPNQLLGSFGDELYKSLLIMKTQGMTRKIGISIYSPEQLELLNKRYDFDIVQAPLNILDRSLVSSGWLARLNHAGIEVHARSAFLQGLLLMPSYERPVKFNRWHDVWDIWDRWLVSEAVSPLQACLRYVTNISEINRVVIGVNSVEQFNQIIEAATGELTSLPKFNSFQDDRLINPSSWNQL